MKKYPIAIALLAPMALCAQKKDFSIQGKIGTIDAPAHVYLSNRQTGTIIDSAEVKNGQFEFNGSVDEAVMGTITLNYLGAGQKSKKIHRLNLYLEPANIKVTSPDSLTRASISGSPVNEDQKKLTEVLASSTSKMDKFMSDYRALPKEKQQDSTVRALLDVQYKAIEEEQTAAYKSFIKAHPNSIVSLDALKKFGGSIPDYSVVAPLFESFSKNLKNTTAGKEYANGLAKMKATTVGAIAPDFMQNDTLGNPIKLSSLRGKYVLVDFWAAWCGPCRAENPNVVKAYARYQKKGFEILGVSLDTEKDRGNWVKAIQNDGLTWPQVSDLKGWGSEVAQLYAIKAIPQNVLLDPTGKIIAKNLRGEALEKKLAELFQN